MVLNKAGDPGTWCVLHDEQALCACMSRLGRQDGIARRCSYSWLACARTPRRRATEIEQTECDRGSQQPAARMS